MKKIILAWLVLLAAAVPLAGRSVGATDAAEREGIRYNADPTPVFPRSLVELGVKEGTVRVVISVDADGRLTEWLVIAYSHVELVDPVVSAIRKWRFEPMRFRGEPRAATAEIAFRFEVGQAVITMDLSSLVALRIESIFGREGYAPCTLKELDRIPTPVKVVSPSYSHEWAEKGIVGEALIEFYIDELGAVRMPSLLSADREAFGAQALAAVREWKFEPPTRDGKPVLVRARQLFRFGK